MRLELFEWIRKGNNREMVRAVLDEIERRAERRMLQTHKLEGMHYSAILDVRHELEVERIEVKEEEL